MYISDFKSVSRFILTVVPCDKFFSFSLILFSLLKGIRGAKLPNYATGHLSHCCTIPEFYASTAAFRVYCIDLVVIVCLCFVFGKRIANDDYNHAMNLSFLS